MKKFVKVLATSAMALSFAAVSAMAGTGNDMPSGAHFQFNLIGSTNGINADDKSNGRAIMIPLGIEKGKQIKAQRTCEFDDSILETAYFEEEAAKVQYVTDVSKIKGVKLHFEPSPDGFGIEDRDATDGDATITVPEVDEAGVWQYDVYVRALGKPNACMNISGWAEETGVWYYAGNIELNRKSGKPETVDANKLFTVNYCPLDTNGDCTKSVETLSVFNDIFNDYFWAIDNKGVRNLQVRIYPAEQ